MFAFIMLCVAGSVLQVIRWYAPRAFQAAIHGGARESSGEHRNFCWYDD